MKPPQENPIYVVHYYTDPPIPDDPVLSHTVRTVVYEELPNGVHSIKPEDTIRPVPPTLPGGLYTTKPGAIGQCLPAPLPETVYSISSGETVQSLPQSLSERGYASKYGAVKRPLPQPPSEDLNDSISGTAIRQPVEEEGDSVKQQDSTDTTNKLVNMNCL